MSYNFLSRAGINRPRFLARALSWLIALAAMPIATSFALEMPSAGLADATVLIVRHAEKPASGAGLSPAGEARALAYVSYFQHLKLNGAAFHPDMLIATADSKSSVRERLTLAPLSKALGIPLDLRFTNKDIAGLVHALTSETHGKSILIAWHHGSVPQLIDALGGDPHALFPDGYWPDAVFDAVVVLRYDHKGHFILGSERLVHEDFANPPGSISGANSQ